MFIEEKELTDEEREEAWQRIRSEMVQDTYDFIKGLEKEADDNLDLLTF